MKYDIKAIETKLMGYTFRSRLEARWAAFFELLGWRWDYEPVDFEGWVPDFGLYGETRVTYVEVKPIVACDREVVDKIDSSSCDKEVLIVGQTCPIPDNEFGPCIGWMREGTYFEDDDGRYKLKKWDWENACFGSFKGKIGFCYATPSFFFDRISGTDTGTWIPVLKDDQTQLIRRLWGEASTASRWVPRR